MSRTVAEILDAALALPEPARAELAELLAVSLSVIPQSPNSAWAAAIRRRAAEFDYGEARGDDGRSPSANPSTPTRDAGSNGAAMNGSPSPIPLFARQEVDAEGRLLPITDEVREARLAMEIASLEAAWAIPDDEDENVTDEMWDEVMRKLGVDPVTGRGLEP